MLSLLEYWQEHQPAHELLALQAFGPTGFTAAPGKAATASDPEAQIGMLPHVAGMLNQPIQPISAETRRLYEYAQGVLKPPKGSDHAR